MRIDWSKGKVISGIYDIAYRDSSFFTEVPENLNSKYVKENYPKLFQAAQRHFGSYGTAVDAAGFDYEKIRKRKIGSQKQVIKEIQGMISKEPLHPCYVKKKHPALFSGARRHFGSWKDAIEATKNYLNINLDYEKIKKINKKWSKEIIINEIKKLKKEGENLSLTSIRKSYPALEWAAKRQFRFGSWKNAVNAAGIDYEEITGEQRKIGNNITQRKRLALKNLEQSYKKGEIDKEIFGERLEVGVIADKEDDLTVMKKELRNMAKKSGYESAINFQIIYEEKIDEEKLYSCNILPVKFISDDNYEIQSRA